LEGAEGFCLLLNIHIGSGACKTSDIRGTMASPPPRLKQLRHIIDLSHPSSAQVTNAHSYTSTHTYALMVWCLIIYYVAYRYINQQRRHFHQEVPVIQIVKKFNLYNLKLQQFTTSPWRNKTRKLLPLHRPNNYHFPEHTMAQVVTHQPISTETQVLSQAILNQSCDVEKVAPGKVFVRVIQF